MPTFKSVLSIYWLLPCIPALNFSISVATGKHHIPCGVLEGLLAAVGALRRDHGVEITGLEFLAVPPVT